MAQRKFIIDGGFQVNDDSIIIANLEMTGNILPTVDSDGTTGYDLGSPTAKWRDLYLSSGSLYIDGQKVMESDAGTIVVQADPDQSLTTKTTGTGVLTFQSPNPLLMAATLQMQSGKKITDAAGTAVGFGDKIDMDSNQIINVGAPTADAHAATKLYVDSLFGSIDQTAISTGDTEVGIADLGTGTVGITVDGTQRFALTATGLAMTVPVTVNGVQLANVTEVANAQAAAEAYADTAEADANTYTDTAKAEAVSTAASDATAKANAAQAAAIAAAATDATTKADAAQAAAIAAAATDATTKADAAEAAANTYTDTAVSNLVDAAPGTLDTLNELAAALGDDANFSTTVTNSLATKATITYVDAEIATVSGNVTTNATNITTLQGDMTTAESDIAALQTSVAQNATDIATNETAIAQNATDITAAISTASSDATTKANAAETAANNYTDTREAAITTAYQAYADQSETDAKAYTDTRETAITTAYQAYADAAEADAISTAAADATSKANAAEADAISTAAADATSKVNAEAATRAAADTALDTAKAEKSINMIAGSGLTGGGTLASNRTFNVGAGTGIVVAADTVSVDTTWADARYVNPSDLTHFHSSVTTVTSGQSDTSQGTTSGTPATVSITFADLVGAYTYHVYLNRQLLRPTEVTVNTANGSVTFVASLLTTDDEIEVVGLK